MNPSLYSSFKNSILLDCPICFEEYNETDRAPMIVCTGQHCFCLKCTNSIILREGNTGDCPECRRKVQKSYLIKFRWLNQIKKTAIELQRNGSFIRKSIEGENQLREQLREERQKNEWLLVQISQKQKLIESLKQKSEVQALELNELHNKIKKLQENQAKNKKILNRDPKTSLYGIYQLSQKNREKYDIEDSVIQYVGQDNKWYQLIINQQIPLNNLYSIKMKILKTQNRWCLLGVLNYQRQKNEVNTYNSINAISYYAEGYKYPGPSKQGKGFFQGEIVQILVDLQQGLIKWIVNGEVRASQKHKLLGDKYARYFPYIEMASKGDKIQIL